MSELEWRAPLKALAIRLSFATDSKNAERATMTKSGDTQSEARFDSPLQLWIAIWQRQLVDRYATVPAR